MDDRDIAFLAFTLPALIIVGGVVVMVTGMRMAMRSAELQHQERIAMIERGLTPPDPTRGVERQRRAHGLKLSLGILMCAFGLGLALLIAFAAGEPGTGVGIGGAIVMVGIGFIVSAMFTEREAMPAPQSVAIPAFRDRAAGEPMVQRRTFDEPIPPPPADQP